MIQKAMTISLTKRTLKLKKKVFLHLGFSGLTLLLILFTFQNTNKFVNSKRKSINDQQMTYPELFKCDNYYDYSMVNKSFKNDNNQTASKKLHELRIVRGLVLYFPIEKHNYYAAEFRWLYRSWIEMQNYEPALWRTDLILNLDFQALVNNSNSKTFFY